MTGLGLSASSPKEIQLPYDQVEAMEIICNIAHFRNNHVPIKLNSTVLLQVAIHIDKYDMIDTCRLATRSWFYGVYVGSEMYEAVELISASYLLREHSSFQSLTRDVVWVSNWAARELHEHVEDGTLPIEVSCTFLAATTIIALRLTELQCALSISAERHVIFSCLELMLSAA